MKKQSKILLGVLAVLIVVGVILVIINQTGSQQAGKLGIQPVENLLSKKTICKDDDGGQVTTVRGRAVSATKEYVDECVDANRVREAFCFYGKPSRTIISCDNEYQCVDGACVRRLAILLSPDSPSGPIINAGLDQLIGAFVISAPSDLTEAVEVRSVLLTISQSSNDVLQDMVLKDGLGNILASIDITPSPEPLGATSTVREFNINSDVFPRLALGEQKTIYVYADINGSACLPPLTEAYIGLEIQPDGVSLRGVSSASWYYTPSSRIEFPGFYMTCTGTGE